jgi:hypothetical protein
MSFVNARPPLTPTAESWRRPATPMPNEFRFWVSAAAARGTAPACEKA